MHFQPDTAVKREDWVLFQILQLCLTSGMMPQRFLESDESKSSLLINQRTRKVLPGTEIQIPFFHPSMNGIFFSINQPPVNYDGLKSEQQLKRRSHIMVQGFSSSIRVPLWCDCVFKYLSQGACLMLKHFSQWHPKYFYLGVLFVLLLNMWTTFTTVGYCQYSEIISKQQCLMSLSLRLLRGKSLKLQIFIPAPFILLHFITCVCVSKIKKLSETSVRIFQTT